MTSIAGPDYQVTSGSLVRPKLPRRNPLQPPTSIPGVAPGMPTTGPQPFGGNGVLPQPPAQPIAFPGGIQTRTVQPMAGAPPGATAIDPNKNLRALQINPVNSADTQQARTGLVGATQGVLNRPTPTVNANPRLASQRGMLDTEATKLAGVDRLKLAQEQFGTYAKATDPEFEQAIRRATEAGAAHGGLGSGMLTNQYGDLATTRARDLTTERDRLFQAAQEGSIADQFNKVSTLQGLAGQTYGEEASDVERGLTDEYRKVGAAGDLFGTLSGADRGERDEYRGERANQQDEAQRAEDSGVRRAQLEAALEAGDFEKALALAQFGEGGNPGAATIGVGAQQGAQSGDDLQALVQLLSQYGYGKARAA